MVRPTSTPGCDELLPRLVDCLATPAFCLARDGTITGWNAQATQLLGHRGREIVGQHCWRVLRGRDEAGQPVCSASCRTRETRDGGEAQAPFRMEVLRADGSRRWVDCTAAALAHRPRRNFATLYQLCAAPSPRPERTQRHRPPVLTPREIQTLRLLGEGLGGEAVASRLGVRNVTARNHVQNLLRKLGVHSRLQAVARARSFGLL